VDADDGDGVGWDGILGFPWRGDASEERGAVMRRGGFEEDWAGRRAVLVIAVICLLACMRGELGMDCVCVCIWKYFGDLDVVRVSVLQDQQKGRGTEGSVLCGWLQERSGRLEVVGF